VTETKFLVGERTAEILPQAAADVATNAKQQFPIPKSMLSVKRAIAKIVHVLQKLHFREISPSMMMKYHGPPRGSTRGVTARPQPAGGTIREGAT